MEHRELCLIAGKYLKNKGICPFNKCQYVVVELERQGECPDAFGISSGTTQLIEVKVSRSDFLSDKKKFWRQHQHLGLGQYRSYMCPDGLISEYELPPYWGLLYVDEKGEIKEIVKAISQESHHLSELHLLQNLLRRNGIKPQIFNYKKYNK